MWPSILASSIVSRARRAASRVPLLRGWLGLPCPCGFSALYEKQRTTEATRDQQIATLRAALVTQQADAAAQLAAMASERDAARGAQAFLEAQRDHALDRAINAPAALFGGKQITGLA